jgi:hypothetical protein
VGLKQRGSERKRQRERELCPRKIKKDDWNLSLLLLFLLLFLFVLLS